MKGLLFTYILTYGGAAASLINPFVGLLIYVAFAILKPEALWHWSVPAGNYSRIIAVALLVGWAATGFGNWRLGRSRAIVFCLLGFFGWAVASAIAAPDHDVAMAFLEAKGKIVLPFLVGATVIDSTRKLKWLAWTIVLSQGYVAYDFNLSYFEGLNKLEGFGFGGMDNNSNAIALVAGIGMAFFLGLQERVWWRKLLAFALAALMTHAVLFSFSRGAMLGLIVVGIVSFLVLPKRPQHYAWFALGAILTLTMAGPEVIAEFGSSFAEQGVRDESAESRVVLWGVCWDMMIRNPVLGIGPDHFPLVVHEYGFPRGKEAHTLWLQTGSELGFPGVFFLGAFYGLAAWRSWRHLRHSRAVGRHDPFAYYVPHMVVASLAGFIVSAQFVTLEGLELPYYVALLAAGTLRVYASEPLAAPVPEIELRWHPRQHPAYGPGPASTAVRSH